MGEATIIIVMADFRTAAIVIVMADFRRARADRRSGNPDGWSRNPDGRDWCGHANKAGESNLVVRRHPLLIYPEPGRRHVLVGLVSAHCFTHISVEDVDGEAYSDQYPLIDGRLNRLDCHMPRLPRRSCL
jgi:hypothetical protein